MIHAQIPYAWKSLTQHPTQYCVIFMTQTKFFCLPPRFISWFFWLSIHIADFFTLTNILIVLPLSAIKKTRWGNLSFLRHVGTHHVNRTAPNNEAANLFNQEGSQCDVLSAEVKCLPRSIMTLSDHLMHGSAPAAENFSILRFLPTEPKCSTPERGHNKAPENSALWIALRGHDLVSK